VKELTSLAIRIDIEEAAIKHAIAKHLILTEKEIEAMIVAALDRLDVKAEIDNAVRSAVRGQVHTMVHDKAMVVARRKAKEVVDSLYPDDDMRGAG
jgi:hypothetical protein